MGASRLLLKFLARKNYSSYSLNLKSAIKHQNLVFKNILSKGANSSFGKTHKLKSCRTYEQFQQLVPISNYEDLKPFISRVANGEKNILTAGAPMYFAMTSGTTSGTKYIPLTREMMSIQTRAIKELLLLYAYQTNNYKISRNMGMMFVQASPKLNYFNKIPFAKLSGISARHVPFFLKRNRYPSMKTNSIENWSKKVDSIVKETYNKDLRIIGGIPPWVITYFEALLRFTTKKNIKEVFSNLTLYIHGGASFTPYKKTFFDLCGDVDTLEVYPASEGFFAYQDNLMDEGMLLLTNHGVFYEFISLKNYKNNNFSRVPLEGVELQKEYVMIVSTFSGLWAYNTGDTIRFVSKNPYKILFSGRASQYCSAFGEHVIEKEVQLSLSVALEKWGGSVFEFTVCPNINNPPQHQWFIEFSSLPNDFSKFERELNLGMCRQNIYYNDLLVSGVIQPLKVFIVKKGGFNAYMKSIGKFGGQNKCPHLSNERKIGDFLTINYV